MATEANGAPPAPAETPTPSASTTTPASEATAAAPSPAAPNTPKLSNAELKAKQKAEKAARRAAQKEAKGPVAPPAAAAGAAATPAQQDGNRGGKQPPKGGKQDGSNQEQQPAAQRPGQPSRRPSMGGKRPSLVVGGEQDPRAAIPECFSHLPMAKRIPTSQANKDVHPAVLAVGQQMATFTVRDSITRLKYMLLAFRKVIESYETPKGNSLSRHFIPHVLNPQIDYLTECRPMSFSMGNAIRLIKAKVNKFDIDTPEDDAKEAMLEMIDNFINERITLAELVIARNAADMIADGDVILTYRHHRLVEKALRQAWRDGKRFEVQVVDDPLDQTGLALAKVLRTEGMRVYYSPHLGGTHQVGVRRASKVVVGGEAIFANGSLYGPAGTCDVCLAASDAGTPVVALCETINFDRDRVSTDPLTYNEIDPERGSGEAFRLLFDTTREKYLGVVVTEYESETGNSPAQSILAILRKQEDQM